MPFVYVPDQPQYGPPNPYAYVPNPITPDIEARAIKIAAKLVAKEEKKKIKHKELEEKKKADAKKKTVDDNRRTFLAIEWFIIGAIAYPILGPLYGMLRHAAQ